MDVSLWSYLAQQLNVLSNGRSILNVYSESEDVHAQSTAFVIIGWQ